MLEMMIDEAKQVLSTNPNPTMKKKMERILEYLASIYREKKNVQDHLFTSSDLNKKIGTYGKRSRHTSKRK